MSLLEVERIKLVSTRSPWWCTAAALGLAIGLAAIIGASSTQTGPEGQTFALDIPTALVGCTQLALPVVMIMATLAVTTEYRFGVIRTTFQASPHRVSVLLAKAAVLAVVGAVIGEVVAFGSLLVARLLSAAPLEVSTGDDLRATAGMGLVYAVAAVLAVAVGSLLRQSAAAVAVLLLFPLAVENLVQLIPSIGDDLYTWMPFVNANRFIGLEPLGDTLGPWGSLGYFTLVAAAVLAVAVVILNRRDA